MTRIGRTFLLSLVSVMLFALAFPALAQNVTIGGSVSFNALDGSADDADHTVNGVFTVNGDLVINGTISCIDDSGRESACPMSFNVGHDLVINAGGALYAENRTGTGSGAPITFTVGHDFVMHGPTASLAGAIVSSDSTSSSGSGGGNITANVTGAVTIDSGATIDSGSANAAAGAIAITAGGHIDANGNVLAGPSRTILSTRLTDAALSGGTGNQVGGAIAIKSTSFIQPGINVGSNANIVSQGQSTSSGPVSLEGCGVIVDGLVASLAYQDASARVVIRSGKDITVDSRDLGVAGATLGRNGMLRSDAPTGTAVNHAIDLFAFNGVSVLGPAAASSSLFAITGTPGLNTSKSDGATIRIISLSGGVTASGNVIEDGRTNSGDDGGNIFVSAASDLSLDHAVITSIGDSNTNNNNRGGGTITLRSYSGSVVWTNGVGDVRPVGSSSGLTTAQGSISITACGAINLSGTSFPTIGSPVGVFPTTATACSPASPSLPAGEPVLPICCNVITITNPANDSGVAGSPFTATFTQTGAIGTPTFSIASGSLPAGLSFSSSGVISGTPTVVGAFTITVQLTDSQGCTGIGTPYTIHIACQTITVTNPAVTTTVAGQPFSATFTQTGAIGSVTWSTGGIIPAGMTFSAAGVLSGTPTVVGTFPVGVTVTDSNGCPGTSTYNLTITCQTITVTNPAANSGTVNVPFSATFTQSGSIGGATFSTTSTLPAGLTLSSGGVLSGTPTQTGSFPIVVKATDGNGCIGTGATYTLTIACQVITVNNPAASSATVNTPFSATFTASNTIGATTFAESGALPAGVTFSASGTLSGTPTQTGSFPIVVTATDANGCSGSGATYTLTVGCQVITVNNPASSTATAGSPFSATFTASNTVGATTFSESGALPAGMSFSAGGTLSGTPTVVGSFPITVTATDANGCSGSSSYTLTVQCQTITVNVPAANAAVAGSPFSATFTASNTIGTTTFSETGVLPGGMAFSASGVLSGTPLQTGSYPIVVTATDANGCSGSAGYTLTVACQPIGVNNPSTNTATANSAFSVTFTASNTIGATTFSESGALPAGVSFASNGTLSGTPTVVGSFPIVVTATDANGCSGSGATYTLTVGCQTITVNNPTLASGTVNAPFSVSFSASNTIGATTFATSSTLPAGLSLAANGTLSGTPLQPGTFSIVVTATDANGCSGSSTYTLTINCQVITVTNPSTSTGTVGAAFSQQFTQSGAVGAATFSTASTLPAGLTLAADGTLSGTPTQSGTFTIVVTATDSNGCTGSSTYTLSIACNVITVTPPGPSTFTAGSAFSVTFTQSGGNGTVSWTESGTLPSGVTFYSLTGVLAGTATQTGSFPITVTATDSNGCTGSASYTLTIICNVISITNPSQNTTVAGTAFSATFTASGLTGAPTWSESGALPSGIALNASSGVLSGTTVQTGSFPITVTVTDPDGCSASSSYTLTVTCQTISVTNPANNTATAGNPFSATFTATGILGTATWSTASTLPSGVTLNASTGVLSGTPTQTGSFPIVVTVTDSNGCSGSGATYTLTVACPTITVARTGGGSFPAATFGVAYSQSVTASGSNGTFTYSVSAGSLPSGVTLNASTGAISGTPTATGTYAFTITATDSYGCSGSSSFSIAVRPKATNDTYSNLVNNTQAYVTGGLTATPATPAVPLTGAITANDAPAGSSVSTGSFATTGGGSVTIAADGTFLYTPPTPFATSDSFTYTLTSDTGGTGTPTTATGTVTLNLANRVWYINPNAALNGNGRSNTPWNTTSSISGTLAGDILFVYANGGSTTNTNAAITLLNNQQLIGQGVNLIVNGFTLVSASSAPTLTATGNDVVTVASGNTIAGVTLTEAANDLISGTSPAGLTVTSSTLAPTGSANGVNVSGATGSVAFNNVTMTGTSSGNVVNVVDGAGNWTFTSSPISQTTGRALNVTSKTSGSMTFDSGSPISVTAGTTDGAISITGSTGGSFTFNGKLAVAVTGQARGVVLTNGGTVTSTDVTSTISTADGVTPCTSGFCSAAIDATTTSLAMTFKSMSVNGSHGNVPVGASFNATSGSFSVVGDGTGHANGSGGSISGATAKAVYIVAAGGTYSFKSMNTTLSATSVNGWLVDDTGGNTTSTVNVTGCTYTGVNSAAQATALLQVQAAGTANTTANVQNSYFNNSETYGFLAQGDGSATMNVTVNQSGFGTDVNTGAAINNPGTAIVSPNSIPMAVTNNGSAQVSYSVTNNTYWGTTSARGAIWAVAFVGSANTASSSLTGSFTGNHIGKSGVLSSGCANNCGGLGLLPGSAGTFSATVQNNDFRQINSTNLGLQNSVPGSTATVIGHINNNTFAEADTTGGPILRAVLVSLGNSGGASVSGCADISSNTIVGPGWSTGAWIRITNANNTVALKLPGLSPTSGATAAQVSAYVESINTFSGGTGTDVSTNIGTSGIIGGTPCP